MINLKQEFERKGYCITCNNDIASWAFSAAVITKEIDIGIDTKPEYKQQGFGMIVANKMIQYTIEQAKLLCGHVIIKMLRLKKWQKN